MEPGTRSPDSVHPRNTVPDGKSCSPTRRRQDASDQEDLRDVRGQAAEGDSDDEVQHGVDLEALTRLKMPLCAPNRIIGVIFGSGHKDETHPVGDWKEVRKSGRWSDLEFGEIVFPQSQERAPRGPSEGDV